MTTQTIILIKQNGVVMVKQENGDIMWYNKQGILHRENEPAIELANGTKAWCRNGKLHRENGPAIEFADGSKQWNRHGELHREDGPAIDDIDGEKAWFFDGKLHRLDGPAVTYADGDEEWYIHGHDFGDNLIELFRKRIRKHKISRLTKAYWNWYKRPYTSTCGGIKRCIDSI